MPFPEDNKEKKALISNNNKINLRDLRAEVIKFRDGKLAPKFMDSPSGDLDGSNEVDLEVNTPLKFASLSEATKAC